MKKNKANKNIQENNNIEDENIEIDNSIKKTFWKIAIPLMVIMIADQAFSLIDFWFISKL